MKRYSFLLLFLFFAVVVPSVSALDLSNVSLSQENAVCSALNFTFVDCYEFWSIFQSFPGNYSNSTVYVNNSSVVYLENCTETDDLVKIDDYFSRGFEPVFEGGIITNWRKIENDSVVTNSDSCESVCKPLVEAVKEQYASSQTPSPNAPVSYMTDEEKQNRMFMWAFGGIVLLAFVYFGGKKFFRGKESLSAPPQTMGGFQHQTLPQIPKPPKPDDNAPSGGGDDGF